MFWLVVAVLVWGLAFTVPIVLLFKEIKEAGNAGRGQAAMEKAFLLIIVYSTYLGGLYTIVQGAK
jgi:hypothetical protein